MGKKNKGAAQDWHEEQRAVAQQAEDLQEQLNRLFYAANKKSYDMPCPQKLASLGFTEAAGMVSKAFGLLAEAEHSVNKQLYPDQYS